MTYSTRPHPLGCACGAHAPIAGLGGSVPLTAAARSALQAKLNSTMADYRIQAADVRRLLGAVQFNYDAYRQAVQLALGSGPASSVTMTRDQLAQLVLGTFGKIEEVLKKATLLLSVSHDANVAAVVDRSITAANRAMRQLSALSTAARLTSAAGVSGLGDAATVGGIAVVIGIILTPLSGPVGLIIIVAGVAYYLGAVNNELDQVAAEASRAMEEIDRICADRTDREACRSEYFATRERIIREQQSMGFQGIVQSMGEQGARLAQAAADPLLGPLGQALPWIIGGAGVLVGGYVLYLTWPLLSGARRVTKSVVGNRRRRRRRSS